MVTITWAVKPNGLRTTTKDGNTDFVVRVEYIITGTDGKNTIEIPYAHNFSVPGDSFTPFSSLTEAQVISWAQTAMGVAKLENLKLNFSKQLDKMANPPPPIVVKKEPWSV